jgi:hypothetical protein
MKKTLCLVISAIVMLTLSQHAFARDTSNKVIALKSVLERATKVQTFMRAAEHRLLDRVRAKKEQEKGGALGFGGTATPNVRCPKGAVC